MFEVHFSSSEREVILPCLKYKIQISGIETSKYRSDFFSTIYLLTTGRHVNRDFHKPGDSEAPELQLVRGVHALAQQSQLVT